MTAIADELDDRLSQHEFLEQARLRNHHGQEQREAAKRAHHQNLKEIGHAAELTHRNSRHGERQQRSGHPEDGGGYVGCFRRRWLLRLSQNARLDGLESRHVSSCSYSYSASGWFSGRARSNAGSLRQAASTAASLGYFVMSTLRRRALNICGTRQMSATVTCEPKA